MVTPLDDRLDSYTAVGGPEQEQDAEDGVENGRRKCRESMLGDKMLTSEDSSACLGMAKAIQILGAMESAGACRVETTSVYGAALAMPQIARSARWPKTMCCLMMRTYLFLLINCIVQTMFIYYIYDSQTNMNPFGSQMHLCDFAAHVTDCPGPKDCHGPGGTDFTSPGDLYPYDIWNTRKFVRDSLIALFPDNAKEISEKVVPGEYGLEGFYCRSLCIFVFMVAIADEFQNIRDLMKLLWNIPTEPLPWVQYDPPTWGTKQQVKDVHGHTELEFVRFAVNGMPLGWKIFNTLFLLVPKIFMWRMLSMAGVHFIMETAAMVDLIVNTTALNFVFELDEMILGRLSTNTTKHIMSNLEDYVLYNVEHHEHESDQEAISHYHAEEMGWSFGRRDEWLIPNRLLWSVGLMVLFTAEYYYHNCVQMKDGSWVSVDMFLPVSAHMEFQCFVTKFFSFIHCSNEFVGGAFWTMPPLKAVAGK